MRVRVVGLFLACAWFGTVGADEFLHQYRELKAKPHLSVAEQKQMDRMLNDATLLRALERPVLRTPATASEVEEQKAAVEMLSDASKFGNSEVAAEVLRSAVVDEQLEEIRQDNAERPPVAAFEEGGEKPSPRTLEQPAMMAPGLTRVPASFP